MPNFRLERFRWSPNWYIVWSEGHRSRRCSTRTGSRREAEAFLEGFRNEFQRGPVATVAECLEVYLEYSDTLPSAERARISASHLRSYFGDSLISDLTPRAIERYAESRPVSRSTASLELSTLRAALRRAERSGLITKAPHIQAPKAGRPRERWLTRGEAAKLLRSCGSEYMQMFVRIALYTGARTGAILDLTWEQVDLERGRIDFGEGEGGKRRAVVPVRGALLRALRFWRKDSGPVIRYADKPVKSIKTGFRNAVRKAKLKGVTPHTLRHTAATWAAQAGVDLFAIGGMLGHSNPQTTKRYAKWHPDYLKEAAEAMLRGPR